MSMVNTNKIIEYIRMRVNKNGKHKKGVPHLHLDIVSIFAGFSILTETSIFSKFFSKFQVSDNNF